MASRNCFDLLVKIIVVLSHVIASRHLSLFVYDVVTLKFSGVKLRIVLWPIMRGAPLSTISFLGTAQDKPTAASIAKRFSALALRRPSAPPPGGPLTLMSFVKHCGHDWGVLRAHQREVD